jgi:SsrA-binding protein
MALVQNKKVHLDYEVTETIEAGIELRGFEVKSLSLHHGSLDGARVIVRGGEAFVVGMYIPQYQAANTPGSYDQFRTRRLLLNKKEIVYLEMQMEGTDLQIVPISVYSNKKIKLQIGLARRRKKADKRQYLREKDDKRQMRAVE